MTRSYKTLGEISPQLLSSIGSQEEPVQLTGGLMGTRNVESRFRGARPAPLTTRQAPEDTQQGISEIEGYLSSIVDQMLGNSDDPEAVSNALRDTNTTQGPESGDFYLPPLESIIGGSETERALGTPDPVNVEGSTQGAGVEMVPADGEPVEEQPESALSVSEDLYSPVAPEYRQSQVVDYSYYNQPLQEGGLRGRSRRGGDASEEVQKASMEAIIRAGKDAGMSNEDIALTLAIARHESGFNPDAAAGTTSAHGLGQFVNRTGTAYGLTDENRWDVNAQARALVQHTRDNIRLAESRGQGREYVYAYHHDGPSLAYGGLDIGRQNVMPRVNDYLELVNQYSGE